MLDADCTDDANTVRCEQCLFDLCVFDYLLSFMWT